MNVSILNVTKKYGATTALSDFSLEITSGGVFGLVGPNGAGKSTLMKILATLLKPSKGSCFLDGTDIQKRPNVMRHVLGYLPQDVAMYPNLTAPEFLDYIASLKSISSPDSKKQINTLLDIIRDHYGGPGRGFDFAYRFPGMNKVLQAAGRVIRSESDRGIVLLIDDRFLSRQYTGLFPKHWSHWRMVKSADELTDAVSNFWSNK